MRKCIYTLKEDGEFSKEHIFPRSIGGSKTLPEDWVSKEFNKLMSLLELKFSRENPLIISERMIEGPKGRKSHTGKFGVSFIKDTTTGELELGYIEKGKPISIPQFIFPYPISFNTSLHARSVNIRDKDEIDQFADQFATSLKTYTDKFDIIRTPDDSFIEKISVGLANKKFYIGIHDQLKKENLYNYLQIILNILNNPNLTLYAKETKKTPSPIEYLFSFTFNNFNYLRVIAKVAFNCLASIKDQEFVLRKEFNEIRHAIVTGKDIEKYVTLCLQEDNFFSVLTDVMDWHNKEHFAICAQKFVENNSGLTGYIGFYGGNMLFKINLSKSKFNDFSYEPLGYICDWKNHKEYKLTI